MRDVFKCLFDVLVASSCRALARQQSTTVIFFSLDGHLTGKYLARD
jgi:hypothetical protein